VTEPSAPRPDPHETEGRVPLEYAKPARGLPAGLQFALGCVISAGAVLPIAFVGGGWGGIGGAVVAPLMVILVLATIAFSLHKDPTRKGWAAGFWTGIGIAGMLAPGQCQPTLKEKLALAPRIIPGVGFEAAVRVRSWLDQWAGHDLREPHWHLGPVSVDAHLQGTGIGTRLMDEYCSRIDARHMTGYLETDKASNVSFYEKFGFETIASATVLDTPNWFMKRSAR